MRRIISAISVLALAFSLVASATSANAAVAGYDSAYAGESAFLSLTPGQSGSFTVFFANTGTTSWTKGSASQVDLAACLDDKVTCNSQDATEAPFNSGWLSATRYATHSQTTVAPGGIGTFTYNVAVPAGTAAGTYRFNGALVLSATGADIRNEGYYQDVTVPAAPPAAATGIVVNPQAADTNTVSEGTTTNANRGAHTYTVTLTGVTACVDLQLIRSGDYTPATGVFRDNELDSGGTVIGNNQADLRTVGTAVFEVVNGVAVTPATRIDCVTVPSTGIITFTVDATSVATTIRPVVFVDANNNDQIDLAADNTSTETNGVGGSKTWVAAPADSAADGADGCAVSLDKTANTFTLDTAGGAVQCANPAASTGDVQYTYDANDNFFVLGVPSTEAEFEAALSRGDAVTVGAYSSSPEPSSTFNITGDGPALLSCTAEKGGSGASNDIKITIDPSTPDYDTDNIGAFYTGFRIQRATVTGGTDEAADGTVGTYATIATSTVDEDATTKTLWEFTDNDVAAGVYRYRCAGIVDGDTGPNTADTNNESSVTPGTSDLSAPTSVDLRMTVNSGLVGQLDTGDQFKIAFSEVMNTSSTGDLIRFQDADGTTMTLRCDGDTTPNAGEFGAICSFNTVDEVVGGSTYAAGRVVTIVVVGTLAATVASEVGTSAGMQIPTTAIDQGGFTDLTGNQWNVTGSSDRVLDIE